MNSDATGNAEPVKGRAERAKIAAPLGVIASEHNGKMNCAQVDFSPEPHFPQRNTILHSMHALYAILMRHRVMKNKG